ncbi:hypothetical protein Q8F55_000022 [Vanrija albida]|uniref:F-box domain-containing protein n=1 Tax=Vanrija albida TaxID=181172 RepID=A0ABR3QD21_9TREE
MTTIDHTAYPAIIDAILAHTDVRGLMALRTTSKAFKQRVDAQLFPRAVFHARGSSGGYVLTDPAGAPLPFAPSGVRVLDLPGELADGPVGYWSSFSSLEALRRAGGTVTDRRSAAFAPATVVDWYDVPPGPGVRGQYIYLPPTTQRYVLHISWRGARPEAIPRVKGADGLREVVIVRPERAPPQLVAQLSHQFLPLMYDGGELTIVGQDVSIYELDESPEGMREWLAAQLRTQLMRKSTAQPRKVDAAMARFRWLSLAEWLAELGDTAKMESTWPEPG